ncbi:HD domain-containing protein (plasmid) [Agrobacterium tumefaciens]|uniref:HD domain-containing protein n=1 Tax=Agrobacterium tumefaciens TaxID=358 RepID=A0AAP9J959_AGRTU|nr:HD domain-containing protein [Agrobacterium tumefaciens]NSZ60098.1 HD domain-containing protein [Agrobacterium tumefaciens]QDY97695.1 HD domain-containing protein [Agrobacterium tumefaciens]UXS12819.1 HD domain-containing protein [Agrobacterium tumefaciens]UXS20181.1 HD domain-containing protein [Agrobacterium tumefaciens]UXS27828.1 HD domain-containing protein [Agrobacterium tumefaciens]
MTYHYARPRREVTDATRRMVVQDFPEIAEIPDDDLRRRTIEAWSYSLSCSGFQRLSDIPPEGNPGSPALISGSQADHVRGVFRYTNVIAREFQDAYPAVSIDWGILLAGAACHDVGKPYEFDTENRQRWQRDPAGAGAPTFRHSVFGMHVCLTVGLPDEVAHIAVGHSFEGNHTGVSTECMIVRQADHGWWHVAAALGLADPATLGGLASNLTVRPLRPS